MHLLSKRLSQEKVASLKNLDEDFVLTCDENDLKNWKAYLFGPKDTPFENGVFKIAIKINDVHLFVFGKNL